MKNYLNRKAGTCLLVTLFLLLVPLGFANEAGNASGKLDETRGIEEKADSVESSPEDSFSIPDGSVAGEQIITEKSPKTKRLKNIDGEIHHELNTGDGRSYFITAKSLAKIEKSLLKEKDDKAARSILRMLDENEAIIGKTKGYDIRIVDYVTSEISGDSIVFRQYVNEIPVQISDIRVSPEGEVTMLGLNLVDPTSERFLPSTFLSEKTLRQLARAALLEKYNAQDDESISGGYEIVLDESRGQFIPTYTLEIGSFVTVIHAVTGEIIYTREESWGERRCQRNSGLPSPSSDGDCDQVLSEVAQYTIFKVNNTCTIPGSNLCTKQEYEQVYTAINNVSTWVADRGSSAPVGYDIQFEAKKANPQGEGAWYHRVQGYPVLSFTPNVTTAPAYVRYDVAGHEAAHMWHQSKNSNNYTQVSGGSGWVGRAFIESTADVIRAFQSNNYNQNTAGTGAKRFLNPTPDLQWGSRVVTQASYYDDSRVLSNFMIDVRFAIPNSKGEKIAIWMAENARTNWHGNPGYSIEDYRQELKHCISNSSVCGLTAAEENTVCSLWAARAFPGSICPPPPVPGKPAWITAVSTGSCGWFWSTLNNAYVYGSVYYFNWANVSNEDFFQLCSSGSPFGPYTCTDNYLQNITTSWPATYVVNGTYYRAVRGCNTSGCGSLTGTGYSELPQCSG